MSHATRHALYIALGRDSMSDDTLDALTEIANMIADERDPLDLDLDAMAYATLDLDLDEIDARAVDPVAYFDVQAFECLDDMIDALDR